MDADLFNLLEDFDDDADDAPILFAAFGWVGGKSRSVKQIVQHLPYRNAYVEPYAGSFVIGLNRKPSRLEVLNDAYSGVTAFYSCLRDPILFPKLIDWLDLTVHSREEFLRCRDTWKDVTDPVERAARWYYSVANSFINKGKAWARSLRSSQTATQVRNALPRFQEIHKRLARVQVENRDWSLCLKDYDSYDTVFYIDPPYLDTDQSAYEHKMTAERDHIKLLDRVMDLQGYAAVSGRPSILYDSYEWDEKHEWEVSVSATSKSFTDSNNQAGFENTERQEKATEVLWIKY